MLRTPSAQACLIGLLAALTTFCAFHACGAEPPAASRSYSIVAQSDSTSAATGRRPVGQRIARANLPLRTLSGPLLHDGCSEHGCPVPALKPAAPLVERVVPPLGETQEESSLVGSDGEADAVTDSETDGLIVQSPDDVPALLPMQPVSREALLARVKRALAGIPRESEASLSIVEMESPPTVVPARLEFNVNESRSVIREGEQIVLRIAVRNVGGEPAQGVAATLFFADGVEPMQAIGQSAEVYPGEVRFDSIDTLPPGDSFNLMVTAIGTRAGSVAYRGELECQQVPGGLTCEGAVTIRPRRQP